MTAVYQANHNYLKQQNNSCVVWATSFPRYLVDQIDSIQNRAMRILFPGLKYRQALAQANVTSLETRRDHLRQRVWQNISANPDYRLHRLLAPTRARCHSHQSRNSNTSSRFKFKINRFGKFYDIFIFLNYLYTTFYFIF